MFLHCPQLGQTGDGGGGGGGSDGGGDSNGLDITKKGWDTTTKGRVVHRQSVGHLQTERKIPTLTKGVEFWQRGVGF